MPDTATPGAALNAGMPGQPGRRRLWQSWLEIEAALAEVQSELGVIPAAAALEIRSKANFSAIDEQALAEDIERTRAPVLSLARALGAACAGDAGGYVHWGATTQNFTQTGRIMLMRHAHDAFMARLGGVLERLASLAEEHAETLTVARTNHRHALPVTFGFKVAGWIDELLRHVDRLSGAEPRVFVSLWGGAAGAMHAFGEHGPEINRRLAQRLGLQPMRVPSRAAVDSVAEYAMLLALLATSCSKIAEALYALMADEYGEIHERLGDDVVGSSTMPHKINPKVTVQVIALAARLRSQLPLALEAMQPTHEADVATNLMMYDLLDTLGPTAFELAEAMDETLRSLVIDKERMRRNLELSPFIAAENAMMLLAPKLGRNRAHDLLHHAIAESAQQPQTLIDRLWRIDEIRAAVERPALEAAFDPQHYTGHSAAMAREMAQAARETACALQKRSHAEPQPQPSSRHC